MRRLIRGAVATTALLLSLGACGSGPQEPPATDPATATPQEVALPEGLVAYLDQSRLDRVGRSVFVRLVHDSTVSGAGEMITVTRAEVSSPRFAGVTWTGEKSFANEADLDLQLPVGSCGTGSDAEVTLTYRVDDGPVVVSQTTATDRYGAIALFLDRDCSEQTLAEAAVLSVGQQRVVGVGRSSAYVLPVTLTPTGARDDVAFTGFQDTVLFQVLPGTPIFPETDPVPLADGGPVELRLRLVPSRCDPHALAEDKVGTLIGVHVSAPEVPETASSYLPLTDEARADLRGFFTTYCGF